MVFFTQCMALNMFVCPHSMYTSKNVDSHSIFFTSEPSLHCTSFVCVCHIVILDTYVHTRANIKGKF